MRKVYWVIVTTVISLWILALPGASLAQEASKIGFVNLDEVLAKSDVGNAWLTEFKTVNEKHRKNIQQKEQELQKLKDELDKQRPILTEQALKDKELAAQKKYRDYKDFVKDADDEMNIRSQDFLNKYMPQIVGIVNRFGEKEKYAMILVVDLSNRQIAYYDKKNDLTKRVLDEFNKTVKK